MVSSLRSKALHFSAFLSPALLFYGLFFLVPFVQGVWYSFTDWNGIKPEIPLTMPKQEFEEEVLDRIASPGDREYLCRFYRAGTSDDTYNLTLWVEDEEKHSREISKKERRRIRAILRTVGVSNIKFVGLDNFREILRDDPRFMPRWEVRSLFNEFEDLPKTIQPSVFKDKLLKNLENTKDRQFVLNLYRSDSSAGLFRLSSRLSEDDEVRLRQLLASRMHETVFVPNVLGFTVFFTFFNVILSNLFALILALILDSKIKHRVALRSIFFMPNVLSLVVVAFIWHFIFMLILPGITGIDLWLGSMSLAPWAVVIVSVWQSCGWLMVIYLAGLQTIPPEYQEAAEVDGASWLQRFRFVRLPLLLPALTVCLFYSLANSLKSFDIIFALTQGNPAYSTVPVVLDIYYNAFNLNRFGYATAKAVLLCIIIMAVTGLQLYITKRREVEL